MEMHIDTEQAAKIKVFGVGGGGGNAIQNMINSKLEGGIVHLRQHRRPGSCPFRCGT